MSRERCRKYYILHGHTDSELPVIYINGGRRGVVAEMAGSVLVDVLGATPVDVANPKDE